MKVPVFLTGTTGFIGRFLAAELLSRGYPLIALARATRKADPRTRVFEALREIPDYHSLPLD
jgi:thioester reductase-like protein